MSLNVVSSFNGVTDPDAGRYIADVEAVDGLPLEFAVGKAIDDFVVGCKRDGIWDAIKASCILAGARTFAGALIPLKGTAPTKFGTEGNWSYNRKTGLQGDGSTNYLNSNRAGNADPQNNHSICVYGSSLDTNTNVYIGSYGASAKAGALFSQTSSNFYFNNRLVITGADSNTFSSAFGTMQSTGFAGSSRSSASLTIGRRNGINATSTTASVAANSESYFIFCFNNAGSAQAFSAARLAFYSIGESLDLARLDSRVTDLINAFGAAIP